MIYFFPARFFTRRAFKRDFFRLALLALMRLVFAALSIACSTVESVFAASSAFPATISFLKVLIELVRVSFRARLKPRFRFEFLRAFLADSVIGIFVPDTVTQVALGDKF